MMAQVHMSVQISLVNFHVHHLSCNMSAQLHSRAQMTTCQLCLADQYLGCNQSGLAAMCEYFGSARTQIASWDATRKISAQLPLHDDTWSASLYYVSSWCNLSAVQMPCQLSCNALAQIVSIKWQLMAEIIHSRCQQSMSRYFIANMWQSSTASKWKGVCCVSSSRCFQWRWSHDGDEVDDPTQIITSSDNIVLQLQKHAKELGVHHLNDAFPALRSQRLQHQQNPSTGCLQQHSHQPSANLCCRRTKNWLEFCAAGSNGLVTLLGFYTRAPTQVVAGKTVFRHSLPTCTKQELTLQLFLFQWSFCYCSRGTSFSGAFATAQGGHGGLYSAAVAQEDTMQGAEEEGLPPSNGFQVANTNQ